MELSNLEKMMLARFSENHVAFIPRQPGQVTMLTKLKERGLVRTVPDPLFGQTWHLTDEGRKALKTLEGGAS